MSEPDQPYAGPPSSAPAAPGPHAPHWGPTAGYGPPMGYGYPAPYGQPAYYGYPGYPPPRPVDRRPGQVITAAVLAFVQAAMVLLASLYLWFFASLAQLAVGGIRGRGTPTTLALASEGRVLALVGVLSAVFLVVPGVAVLTRRSRGVWVLLLLAYSAQVVLSAYWLVRLVTLSASVPEVSLEAPVLLFALLFVAGPVVSLGMVLVGPGRRWFDVPASGGPAASWS